MKNRKQNECDPTKRAVALKYEPGHAPAPQVVAKGSGHVAENIVNKAQDHNVEILEDSSLMQVLYPLRMGEFIPQVLYQPVAKILSYLLMFGQKHKSVRNGDNV